MKRKGLIVLLGAVAATCVGFCLLDMPDGGGFTAAAFPLVQIGAGLRTLSLMGGIGNAAAVTLYLAVSLLPGGYALVRAVRGRAQGEEGLLILLSIALLAVLYWMVNPADLAARAGHATLAGGYGTMLGVTVYAMLAGYIVLRALRRVEGAATQQLLRAMKLVLAFVSAALVVGIFGSGLGALLGAWQQLGAGNTGVAESALVLSYTFLVLQYLVDVLPSALGIVILFSCLSVLDALEDGFYCAEAADCARKTGQLCGKAVVAIFLAQIAVNCLQVVLGPLVRAARYTLSLPVLPVLFVLAAMLAARFFAGAKQLKDDNDGFI